MGDKDHRKKLHNRRWGNWRYNADDNELFWDRGQDYQYPIYGFDSADTALRCLAQMNTKKGYEEQDMKNLAEAFSEILRCPGLANAYDARYHTLRESKDKVLRDSGSACDNCADRWKCYFDLNL